jgi:hypothetical protein
MLSFASVHGLGQALLLAALFVCYAGAIGAWLLLPIVKRRRQRRLIERARQEALVDADFSDRTVIDACRPDLARLEGEHDFRDRDALRELVGEQPADWIYEASRTRRAYRTDILSCDVVRVLDRGEEGTRRVVACVNVRIVVPGRFRNARRSWCAYWTLTNSDGNWRRSAVEDQWTGRRHLKHDPLRAPELDVERLHDRVVLQEADQRVDPAELLTQIGDLIGRRRVTQTLRDLALVDERYELSVIESCVRRLLAAWDLASNGKPSALDEIAEANATKQLLNLRRGEPTIVREPQLTELKVIELDARLLPPTVTVLLTVKAEPDIRNLSVYWKLALAAEATQPWVLRDAHPWKNEFLFAAE